MDLIDASNIPTPITVDPLTSNTIVSNPAPEVSSNAPMIDPDVDMDAASAPATSLTVQSCTVFPFEALNYDQKGRIIRLLSDIAHAWDISSPASAFPYRYHPDPDTHNWGHALLTSMSRLAQLTQAGKSLQAQAVQHAIDHLQDRNDGMFERLSLALGNIDLY
jgi:hypothetical protein